MSLSRTPSQSGNMLVYILGAIFLLGLLVVITKGNYQPGAGIDQEALTMKVSEVRRYGSELERGVNYILQNGQSETAIRFAHPSAAAGYGTYGTTPKAEVFNPAGGGVEWKDPPAGIQTTVTPWFFNARNVVANVGSTASVNSAVELLAVLGSVTKDFCLAVNTSIGVPTASGVIPKENDTVNLGTPFVGAFTYGAWLNTPDKVLDGFQEGCIEGNTGSAATGLTGTYYYYKVLLTR